MQAPPKTGKPTRLRNSQEPADFTATDARVWTKILAHYRQPSNGRGIVEIAITLVPLAALWALAWLTLDVGYWLALPFSLAPSAFLLPLFSIQHDCPHGSLLPPRLGEHQVHRRLRHLVH